MNQSANFFLFTALATPETDSTQKKQRRIFRSQILRHMALSAKEGSDWKLLHNQSRAKAANTTDTKSDSEFLSKICQKRKEYLVIS